MVTWNSQSFILKLKLFLIAWLWVFCTFLHSPLVSLKSSPYSKYTYYGTIFQKNHVLLSNFFSSSNMFFIRLFLANTWKKIWCHRACFLTDCRERWRDRSRDGEFARWGLGRDTKWCPSYSKYALDIKLTVLGCFSTEIRTWKKCKNNKDEVSQDLMRFWSYEPLAVTICSAGVLLIPTSKGFDFFA